MDVNINKISVSELLFSHAGTRTDITVELPEFPDTEVRVLPGQKLDFEGIKIDDGVCFYPTTTTLDVEFNCVRCLKLVKQPLVLRPLEKQFYVTIPEDIEEDLVQLIDKRNFEINLQPLVEEIVYLSVPTILSCGPDCPGAPDYTHAKTDTVSPQNPNTPFAGLKDLLK